MIEILCILLFVLGPMGSEPQAQRTSYAPSQPHVPRKYLERLWGHRKKLSFRLATVLSLSLGLCYQSRYILFEATTSRAWKTPLPLGKGAVWITGASLLKVPGKGFPSFPTASEQVLFCFSCLSLASLLS